MYHKQHNTDKTVLKNTASCSPFLWAISASVWERHSASLLRHRSDCSFSSCWRRTCTESEL